MTTEAITPHKPGLEGVVAAETRLSHVDGQKGELWIGGYPVEEIAPNASFEEVVWLLWQGERIDAQSLTTFGQQLATWRTLPQPVHALLATIAQEKHPVMDALRMVAGLLDLDAKGEDVKPLGMRLLARLPTVVAAYWRLLQGQAVIAPDPTLSHAANYLYMLRGERPSDAQVRGLNTYLNTVIDHGLNASTFAARVIIATQTDLTSAIVGGIGALKGPLHGGAPGPALELVFEIGAKENAEAVIRAKLERGERLMGFGHRIYKVRDPRADVLAQAVERLFADQSSGKVDSLPRRGGEDFYELAKEVESVALRLLEEYKPGRNLRTNVEFYTALLLHSLGLESDLFSPTFAVSRAAGWIAHCHEQLQTGRIIRPQSRYVGEFRQGMW